VCLFLSTNGLLHKVNDAGVLHEELYASQTAVHVMQHEQAVSSKATSRHSGMKEVYAMFSGVIFFQQGALCVTQNGHQA
jgi:hypothetical protein